MIVSLRMTTNVATSSVMITVRSRDVDRRASGAAVEAIAVSPGLSVVVMPHVLCFVVVVLVRRRCRGWPVLRGAHPPCRPGRVRELIAAAPRTGPPATLEISALAGQVD